MKNKNQHIAAIRITEKAIFTFLAKNGWGELVPGTYCKERERINSLLVSATTRKMKSSGIDKYELNVIASRYDKGKTKIAFHLKLNGKEIYRLEQDRHKDWHLQESDNEKEHIEIPLKSWQEAIKLIIKAESSLPGFVRVIGARNCIKLFDI